MILSFGNKDTLKISNGERVKGVATELQELARRKLRMLNNVQDLRELMVPPSNRLERLRGNLKEYHSIRVNNQWRIIFIWQNGNAEKVEFVDYH